MVGMQNEAAFTVVALGRPGYSHEYRVGALNGAAVTTVFVPRLRRMSENLCFGLETCVENLQGKNSDRKIPVRSHRRFP